MTTGNDLKLGWHIGYWGRDMPPAVPETLQMIEALGFDSVWTAESWGSDAISPLAWWGSGTTRLRLGTNLVQISARTPAATAMAAVTMDHLSGGRFCLGLGVSGPQVVEGWYGQRFTRPLARTREYVEIVRKVLARTERLTNDGPEYPIPARDGVGLGKALNVMTHPLRADLPIFLGAEGPKNVALAAEIADGWFPLFYAPRHEELYAPHLEEGFARPGARRRPDEFEVLATVTVAIDDDEPAAYDRLRPYIALYVGGMGAQEMNFHADVFRRLGYEAEVDRIQQLFLSGHQDDAIAAVPDRMVEEICLVGSRARVRDLLAAWRESRVTTMLVGGPPETLRTVAELVLG
ncbi:MAG: LLM class F420-dependent oxidoreductase [Ilumatobacteraceae bacterium]|nr:MAG: LLM class F420-dependent oxidoreductase [Actinomycetota bacterium]